MSRYLLVNLIAAAVGMYLSNSKGRSWALWGVICGLFPLSLLVLLIIPPVYSRGITKKCPGCGGIMRQSEVHCGHCGRQTPIEMVQCPKCGKFVPEGERCEECDKS
jgi:hypothetical protein